MQCSARKSKPWKQAAVSQAAPDIPTLEFHSSSQRAASWPTWKGRKRSNSQQPPRSLICKASRLTDAIHGASIPGRLVPRSLVGLGRCITFFSCFCLLDACPSRAFDFDITLMRSVPSISALACRGLYKCGADWLVVYAGVGCGTLSDDSHRQYPTLVGQPQAPAWLSFSSHACRRRDCRTIDARCLRPIAG